jgi:hypothetical protein
VRELFPRDKGGRNREMNGIAIKEKEVVRHRCRKGLRKVRMKVGIVRLRTQATE